MGMASSDNDVQIIQDHSRNQYLRTVPRHPGSWDKPAPDDDMAHYDHALREWAQGIPEAYDRHAAARVS
jgi:hypothetical protein